MNIRAFVHRTRKIPIDITTKTRGGGGGLPYQDTRYPHGGEKIVVCVFAFCFYLEHISWDNSYNKLVET